MLWKCSHWSETGTGTGTYCFFLLLFFVSYRAIPVPCTGPVPFPCSMTVPLRDPESYIHASSSQQTEQTEEVRLIMTNLQL